MVARIEKNITLVKPDLPFRKTKDGYWVADHYEPGLHAPISGEVMIVPDRLEYHNIPTYKLFHIPLVDAILLDELNRTSVDCYTKKAIEINVGDRIMYNYAMVQNADEWDFVDYKDQVCVLMDYSQIYLKITGDQIHMLNGFILVECDFKHDKRKNVYSGVVRYANEICFKDEVWESEEIQVGTKVLWARMEGLRMEVGMHQTIKTESGRPLYLLKRREVMLFQNL